MMTVGDFLTGDDKLLDDNLYRHDTVYVVSDRVEHSGLDHKKVPEFMKSLIAFVNADDDINDLIKAAIIHFYIAYVHPYFDGNGRMARLVHLWFLIQKGYQSALFIPFSSQIEKSRKAYYDALTAVEENKNYSGKIDVTPFILYFINNIYNKINGGSAAVETLTSYEDAVKSGKVTEKETKLWKFVLSCYGTEEFSTKRLEKDFGDAAYATIRGFVLKFEELGLLCRLFIHFRLFINRRGSALKRPIRGLRLFANQFSVHSVYGKRISGVKIAAQNCPCYKRLNA